MAHEDGSIAMAYRGWSWTCLFWVFIPPLFRRDITYFLIFMVVQFLIARGERLDDYDFYFAVVHFVLLMVIAAKYNDWHYYSLTKKGYRESISP